MVDCTHHIRKEVSMKKAKALVSLLAVLLLLVGVQGLWASGSQTPASEEVYQIKIGHANIPADNSALHVTGMVFKELVEQYSNGRIKAEIYPSGQLGSDAEMADLVVSGAQEVLVTSLNLITQYAPLHPALHVRGQSEVPQSTSRPLGRV
jgi:C4-dicarboxylate-binding protein DctP